jgi:general secretion pathway protein C
MPSRWTVRSLTFMVWALGAASVAYWALKVAGAPAGPAAAPLARGPAPDDPSLVARLLGSAPVAAAPAAPSLSSRFTLLGVVAGPGPDRGAALIAVDGKAAKPYRIGTQIDDGLVLQSVEARRAVLAAADSGQPVLTLELPPPRK